ncbi:MAG: hypothetical protein PHE21_00580 [Candidatus Dojkabacteria bacterium]|nr:hypothetical protein [Candidatus Dojkabacteria bacterium]
MIIQENLIATDLSKPVQETVENQLPGSRLSISKIEKLIDLNDMYQNSSSEYDFEKQIQDIEPMDKEKALKSAKWSIYGTLIHNYQYFDQIFTRASQLNHYPNFDDFLITFPFKGEAYSQALYKITEYTKSYSDKEDITQNFWNDWRMNGQDYTNKKQKEYIVRPQEIKDMWEGSPIPFEDLYKLKCTLSNNKDAEKLNPLKSALINESLHILNIQFPTNKLQLIAIADEINIPQDFPYKKLEIIDYKTGKQFKQPDFKDKLSAFLITISVYITMIDKIKNINYELSDWDLYHDGGPYKQLGLRKESFKKHGAMASLYYDEIVTHLNDIRNNVSFSYVNPINNSKIELKPDDIFLNESDLFKILSFIEQLNNFNIKYKNILKKRIDSKYSPYTLPSFPNKKFEEVGAPISMPHTQIRFDI